MTFAPALALEGVLSAQQLADTGKFILSQQLADGSIPWWRGGKLDPWDHVEAAMGLSALGHHDEALAAYEWSARTQADDGSWPMEQTDGVVTEAASDTNQCAYIATGVWHHHLVTGSTDVLLRYWPTVERAIDFVVRQQRPGGELAWAVDPQRKADDFALRTGSASALHSITCAIEIAGVLGESKPGWQRAAKRLRDCLVESPRSFADRDRYSMDWYYPVLGGALRGCEARDLIEQRWDEFVWPGFGVRCVNDHPWVTAAESCELVMSLDAIGETASATKVLSDIQCMRDETTGGYWTGYVVADEAIWPEEQTTWTASAVVLAVDAVTGTTGGSGIFRDYALAEEQDADGAAS
ncbi:prenyltransferase/squalene oxidase repeat-containing protein [Luteipulveratus halotolerans]|uniref:Prenyltransferase n=1 Tax=Luteipulveratus halotolerans TaxID=1631356 RepID=A0A0L6CM26_9MICO|nr:prenyltransferase [Luteipulveratus halotolerans]KNX38573.1 prenyltransferase [Luteipulveratus halotolerans]